MNKPSPETNANVVKRERHAIIRVKTAAIRAYLALNGTYPAYAGKYLRYKFI